MCENFSTFERFSKVEMFSLNCRLQYYSIMDVVMLSFILEFDVE